MFSHNPASCEARECKVSINEKYCRVCFQRFRDKIKEKLVESAFAIKEITTVKVLKSGNI